MIKAPTGFDIHEQYDFYRQQAYRRYTRGGVEGVIVFLTELLQENVLISRILKKQYREFMSDEQSGEYNYQFEHVLRGYRNIETTDELALYTAAALLDRSPTASRIIKESAYRAAERKTFLKKYNEAFRAIYQLDFLSDMDFVQFILFKFQNYNRKLRYDDLFENYDPIILNPNRKNNPLKVLVREAVKESEYKYLWYLTRILPNMTLAMADKTEEELLEAGKNVVSNQYAHYINFCIRMWLRRSEDPKERLELLKDCCDRMCEVFSLSNHPEEIPYVRTMQLIGSIWLNHDNVMHYLDEYEYQPADPRDLINDQLRDMTDQVFELLFHNRPSMVQAFIETLKDNNPYWYTDNRDFQYAARRPNSTCEQWISDLCDHYDQAEIISIFMNSNLRSCYAFSRFLNQLFRDEPRGNKDLRELMKDYLFTGQISKKQYKGSFELLSYSFRNEKCRILTGYRNVKKIPALRTQFLDDPEVNVLEKIRFAVQSANLTDDPDDLLILNVLLQQDWKAENYQSTREYRSYSLNAEENDSPLSSTDLI